MAKRVVAFGYGVVGDSFGDGEGGTEFLPDFLVETVQSDQIGFELRGLGAHLDEIVAGTSRNL